jgi:L-asparaginase II
VPPDAERPDPVLVEAWRGPAVESWHRGAVAIADSHGRRVLALGDIDRPVFPRSAVKLLQALPLIASGAADAYRLTDEELALVCGSHQGEPQHVETASRMLARVGLDADVLECGAHWPSDEASARALAASGRTPLPLHNNCSGKHAGFVCLGCRLAGVGTAEARRAFLRGYVEADHPVMREVRAALEAATGLALDQALVGRDGCSIPTYAIPLQALARAFARVATGEGLVPTHAAAAQRLRRAAARAPWMVAGSRRFDTRVMERLGERVCCKVGAEGVYCAALPDRGLGVAIKVDDGTSARACEVVMAAVIEALVALDAGERELLSSLSKVTLRNWRGFEVGRLVASDDLREALSALPRG